MEETFRDKMKSNESSSCSGNREYFQILEIQRREFLMEILDKCDNGPKRIGPKILTLEEEQEWLKNFRFYKYYQEMQWDAYTPLKFMVEF